MFIIILVFGTCLSLFVIPMNLLIFFGISKYNFAKIKIHLTESEKATKINIQKKINGK